MVVFEKNGRKYELVFRNGNPYIRRLRYDVDIKKASPKRLQTFRNFALIALKCWQMKGLRWWKGVKMPPMCSQSGLKLMGRVAVESLTDKEKRRLELLKEAFGVEGEGKPLLRRLKAKLQLLTT